MQVLSGSRKIKVRAAYARADLVSKPGLAGEPDPPKNMTGT